VLQGLAAAGGIMMAGPAFAADDPTDTAPQKGDFLTRGATAKALTPEDIRVGNQPIKAFAMSPEGVVRNGGTTRMLLIARFADADLSEAAKAKAADGVLVYTSICTHAGCDVTGWLRDTKVLECPCHGSHFDPKNNGAVVTGPASRELPQLGIAVVDGKLVVSAPFTGRIGGDEVM
jgi:Rieske Fe-S protein